MKFFVNWSHAFSIDGSLAIEKSSTIAKNKPLPSEPILSTVSQWSLMKPKLFYLEDDYSY